MTDLREISAQQQVCPRLFPSLAVTLTGLLCAALVACGGGGGGGPSGTTGPPPPSASVTGNRLAPSSGPGDTQRYFPLDPGDSWLFNATTTDVRAASPAGDLTLVVNGTKFVLNQNATVLTQTSPVIANGSIDNDYFASAGGISFLGNSDATDPITPQIVPYAQLLFPVSISAVSTITGKNLPLGKDSAGNPITLDFTQTIANADVETVAVPAGTYTNALKQVTTISGTAVDGSQSILVSGSETSWLVPGIGIVKDITVGGAASTSYTQEADLKGYVVAGKRHGFGVPTLLSPQTNFSFSGNLPAAIGSDGNNFLLVTQQVTSTSGSADFHWIATVLRPDGSVASSVDLASVPPFSGNWSFAAVGFDGNNYLVIYGETNVGINAVRLSAAGAILGPAVPLAAQSGVSANTPFALGFDGSQYLLVYLQQATNAVLVAGQFLSPATGQPTGAPFLIAPNGGNQTDPALAFDGINYLVAWQETASAATLGLNVARVSTSGVVLDPVPLNLFGQLPGLAGYIPIIPSIAFDGTNYLVAYRDSRPVLGGSATVSAARVSPAGVLLDGSPTTPGISVTMDKTLQIGRVSVAFLGTEYWLVWDQSMLSSASQLFAARISKAGVVASPGPNGFPLIRMNTNDTPAIGANPQSGILTWRTDSGGGSIGLESISP
jgi:hypothetical protein